MSEPDPRPGQAEGMLRELGLDARVRVRGHEGEIASVWVPERDRPGLVGEDAVRLAARIRALGFRFVALDLGPAPDAR